MAIDLNLAAQKYAQNTPASANFWAQAAQSKANEWEAKAKSQEAEQNYAQAMQFVVQNQLRLKGLQNVTATDYAQGVANSMNVFQTKTANASGKWQNRFAPFASIIDRVVDTLPPRTPGNPDANIDNRVKPIARALHEAKVRGVTGGYAAPAPMRRGIQL